MPLLSLGLARASKLTLSFYLSTYLSSPSHSCSFTLSFSDTLTGSLETPPIPGGLSLQLPPPTCLPLFLEALSSSSDLSIQEPPLAFLLGRPVCPLSSLTTRPNCQLPQTRRTSGAQDTCTLSSPGSTGLSLCSNNPPHSFHCGSASSHPSMTLLRSEGDPVPQATLSAGDTDEALLNISSTSFYGCCGERQAGVGVSLYPAVLSKEIILKSSSNLSCPQSGF